jgi:hypothetical protein
MVCSLTFTEHLMRKRSKHNIAKANRGLIISFKKLQYYVTGGGGRMRKILAHKK